MIPDPETPLSFFVCAKIVPTGARRDDFRTHLLEDAATPPRSGLGLEGVSAAFLPQISPRRPALKGHVSQKRRPPPNIAQVYRQRGIHCDREATANLSAPPRFTWSFVHSASGFERASPRLASPCLALPCLACPCLGWPFALPSPRLALPALASPRLASSRLALPLPARAFADASANQGGVDWILAPVP